MSTVRRIMWVALNGVVLACAPLFVVAVALWAATWHTAIRADVNFSDSYARLLLHHGSLYPRREADVRHPYGPEAGEGYSETVVEADPGWTPDEELPPPKDWRLGFAGAKVTRPGDPDGRREGWVAAVPLWLLVLLLALPPAVWMAFRRARRRAGPLAGRRPVSPARRGGNRLFNGLVNGLTAASVLLLAASAGLWLQASRWHEYLVQWDGKPDAGPPPRQPRYALRVEELQGGLVLVADHPELGDASRGGRGLLWDRFWRPPDARGHHPPEPHPFPWFGTTELYTPPLYPHFDSRTLFGSGDMPPRSPPPKTGREWVIPYWFLILLAAPFPTARLVMWLRRKRRFAVGSCQGCGYDLRASPDRCPECGRAVPAAGARTPGAAQL